jgi:hypothetical protein
MKKLNYVKKFELLIRFKGLSDMLRFEFNHFGDDEMAKKIDEIKDFFGDKILRLLLIERYEDDEVE